MDARGSGTINVHDHGTVFYSKNKFQCNYCGKVVSGSTRLKYHIGGIRGDVLPCNSAPADVRELMKNNVIERKRETFGKEFGELNTSDLSGKRNCKRGASQNAGFQNQSQEVLELECEDSAAVHVSVTKRGRGAQQGDNGETKRDIISRQVQKCIGRFFYETGLEFVGVNSSSFERMIRSALGTGQLGYKIPTCDELRGWILDEEVKEMQEYVTKIRDSWATTGCSILLDGWTDEKGRSLVNFLVNCPQGPIYLCTHDISSIVGDIDAIYMVLEGVIEDVGIENVIQVVADTTTGWAGTMQKEFSSRCKDVFWTVSASHCIALILENIGMIGSTRDIFDKAKVMTKFIHGHEAVLKLLKKHTLGHDLIKPSKIRSAVPFMTLENIVSKKQNLKDMFSSPEWNMSAWASRVEGKRVADLVEGRSFWTGAEMVLNAAMPLIGILNWIFEADEPLIGYIYETMDQVKETIKEEFNKKKPDYMPIWEVVDEIWNNVLHSPLHAAGYYLNPSLFYSSDFYPDFEVSSGLLSCLGQLVQSQPIKDLIIRQLEEYAHGKGSYQEGSSRTRRRNVPPAMWWSSYGENHPELQRFAVRILSQNCDGALRYVLKRTMAEKLLTNGRNPVEQQRLKYLTFVHYNLQLQQFHAGMKSGVEAEEIDPMDDWIIDEAPDVVPQNLESSWMNLDCARALSEEGCSRFAAKTETI
ncbi:hypothetical protein ACFX15_045441 [Malus domestica]|nr:uncharacterized protein LOC103445133 [Malus domestica]